MKTLEPAGRETFGMPKVSGACGAARSGDAIKRTLRHAEGSAEDEARTRSSNDRTLPPEIVNRQVSEKGHSKGFGMPKVLPERDDEAPFGMPNTAARHSPNMTDGRGAKACEESDRRTFGMPKAGATTEADRKGKRISTRVRTPPIEILLHAEGPESRLSGWAHRQPNDAQTFGMPKEIRGDLPSQ